MLESRPVTPHSTDGSPGSGRHLLVSLIFLFSSLLPVFICCFFQASSSTGPGRIGLIMPALILAEESSRMVLWRGVLGAGVAGCLALMVGGFFGLAAVGVRSKISKLLINLVLLPGQCPAWLFPVGWLAFGRRSTGYDFLAQVPLLAWLLWVGWWGGIRLAAAVRHRASQIKQSQWDAAALSGAGHWQSARMVLKPMVLADVRQELRTVVGVALFDPTPVFFMGVSHWPVWSLVDCFRENSMLGASLAATWGFWMILVLAVWFGLIQLLTRSRHCVETISSALEDQSVHNVRASRAAYGTGWWLFVFGLWPWLLLAIGFKSLNLISLSHWLESLRTVDTISDGFFITSGVIGVCIGLFVAWVLSVLMSRLGRSTLNQLHRLTAVWPVGLVALGLALMVQAPAAAQSNLFLGWLVSPFLAGLISPVMIALLAIGRAGGLGVRHLGGRMQAETTAAFEAALLAGASPGRAVRLAGRSALQIMNIKEVASLFVGWWWVWSAPAWALAGGLGGPWGALLVSRMENQPEQLANLWLLTITPVVLAKAVQYVSKV